MKSNKEIIAGDLKGLLSKYLTQEQINEYMRTMAMDFLPLQPLRLTSTEDQLNKFFNENIQTNKVRILSDTLITFIEKNLSFEHFMKFLLEFSKMNLVQGEFNLSFELANYVYNSVETKTDFEVFKAHALVLIAEYYLRQALQKDAFNSLKSARAIYEALDNKNGLGKCEFLLGAMYIEKGDLKAGKIRLENCLSYIDQSKEIMTLAQVETNLGIINYIEGNLEVALEFYNSAQARFYQMNDHRRKAEVMLNKAMIFRKLGKRDEALELFNEASAVARCFGYAPILNLCFLNKAELFLEMNELDRAANYTQKAIEMSYLLNDKLSIAEVHKLYGIIAKKQKKYTVAENYLLTSLRLNHELNQELNAAETEHELGILYKERGAKSEALTFLTKALSYYNKNNSKAIASEIQEEVVNLNN
ncbi:MAG: tetratricopeptide repeat protein [Ignavibacteria bacterium]|nr:tetratricopeptide repeat protein [Ignavibacteria bacterium]